MLDDALAIGIGRQFGFWRAQAPLAAAVIAADPAFDDRQLAQRSEYLRPFGGARQQLPRRGRQAELVEQLFCVRRSARRGKMSRLTKALWVASSRVSAVSGQRSISAVMTLF